MRKSLKNMYPMVRKQAVSVFSLLVIRCLCSISGLAFKVHISCFTIISRMRLMIPLAVVPSRSRRRFRSAAKSSVVLLNLFRMMILVWWLSAASLCSCLLRRTTITFTAVLMRALITTLPRRLVRYLLPWKVFIFRLSPLAPRWSGRWSLMPVSSFSVRPTVLPTAWTA